MRAGTVPAGTNTKDLFEHDLALEMRGVKAYNEAIDLCVREKDAVSREIMEHLLVDSESHVDWLETQLRMIGEIGLEAYLAEQMGEKSK